MYQPVPWGIKDIGHFVFINVLYFLILIGSVPFFKSSHAIFCLNIALVVAVFLYFKLFLFSLYENGWKTLLESNICFPHRKKIALGLGIVFGIFLIQSMKAIRDLTQLRAIPILLKLGIMGLLIAPVTEELWFRSFIYRGLRNSFGVVLSIVGSSLLFSVYHIFNFTWPVLFFGPVIAFYYEKTGSISGCILIHFTANLIYLLYLVFLPVFM